MALKRSYHSTSGVDIQAFFGPVHIGSLQGVSYTVTREKAPNYTMGSPDPRGFSRGKRGIAGSLIFLIFDHSNLINELTNREFYARQTDIRNKAGGLVPIVSRFIDDQLTPQLGPERFSAKTNAWYHDQLPPFDIVLTSASEDGRVGRMMIHNVEIMNMGSGISIDDITIDENMTFVCTDITPWHVLQEQQLAWSHLGYAAAE